MLIPFDLPRCPTFICRLLCSAGDRAGQVLVGQLLEAASEPYFGILRQWLCWGLLDDPYNEFMIKVELTPVVL